MNFLETGRTRPPKLFCSQNWRLCTTDLANGQVVSVGTDHLHLDTVHQALQLVPDVPGSSHGAELDEVLVAPLCGVTALHPLWEKDITTPVSTPGFWAGASPDHTVFTDQSCETAVLNLWVWTPQGLQDKFEGLQDIRALKKHTSVAQSCTYYFPTFYLILVVAVTKMAQMFVHLYVIIHTSASGDALTYSQAPPADWHSWFWKKCINEELNFGKFTFPWLFI